MPIYEFKCRSCSECFEILVMSREQKEVEMRCPHCGAEEFERVLSCTSYAMGAGGSAGQKTKTETRTCSGGSCSTLEIPGPSK